MMHEVTPEEMRRKIQRIRITTSRMVTDVFAGRYRSVFKGRGMEFEEVREYQPGDDIRYIDRNVTARTGHPFIKIFAEERELTVMLLLDLSASFHFGTVDRQKRHLAAEIASLLAFAAIKNNDKVGLIIFAERVEKFVPPRNGQNHVMRIIRDALYHRPQAKGTNLGEALRYLDRAKIHRRSVAFIISDFYSGDIGRPLSAAAGRHDIVALSVTDPRDTELPDIGLIKLADAETGKNFLVDTSSPRIREKYRACWAAAFQERKRLFAALKVDHIGIRTDIPYARELDSFFRMRERRMRS